MPPLSAAFLAVCACVSGFAAQSLTPNGIIGVTLPNSAPWTTIFANTQPLRWEMRVHSPTADQMDMAQIGPMNVNRTSTGVGLSPNDAWWGDTVSRAMWINVPAGWTDIIIRAQRDVVNSRYTLEVFKTSTGETLTDSANASITAYAASPSWGNRVIQVRAGQSVAYLRWYSTVVAKGTVPSLLAPGDLASWEFDGGLTDSGPYALTLSGSPVIYGTSPVYPPMCSAGSFLTAQVGGPDSVDGSASYPLDGASTLTYEWSQTAGPASVTFSDTAGANPTLTGVSAFGQYDYQLTVTDGSGQSTSCTVSHGAVATDANDVVTTGHAAFDTLYGPIIRWGANPWPWFDNREQAKADQEINILDTYYPAYWDTADPGTITVTQGSAAVVGSGTTFTTTFCQGPGSPTVPKSGISLVGWYSLGAGTGRREIPVASCTDDTHLTLDSGWPTDTADGSMQYADNSNRQWWSYNMAPANYYDNVAAFYAAYYRSGLTKYVTNARKLADRFWRCPQIDQGNKSGAMFLGRSQSMMGMFLRATDPADPQAGMWTGLRKWLDYHGQSYIGHDAGNYQYDYSWSVGGVWDQREVAYHVLMMDYGALFDPDPTYKTKYQRWVGQAISLLYAPRVVADGSIPQWWGNYNSYTSGGCGTAPATPCYVTLTNGSTTATAGPGVTFQSGWFSASGGFVPYMWFLTGVPSSQPANNSAGDATTYSPTFVNATTLTLDRPYEGTTGNHGWVISSPSVDIPFIGYGSMPYMTAMQAISADLAAKALATADPTNSELARTITTGLASWLNTYAYRATMKALYYGEGMVNCQPPIAETVNPCTYAMDAATARVLNAMPIRALSLAYSATAPDVFKTLAFKTLADALYNAAWAKPATCDGAPCVSDGAYLNAYDDTGWYMTSVSPTGIGAKFYGEIWGFGAGASWPAARLSAPSAHPNIRSSSRVAVWGKVR